MSVVVYTRWQPITEMHSAIRTGSVNEIMRVVDEVITIHVNKIAGATRTDASHNCSLLT